MTSVLPLLWAVLGPLAADAAPADAAPAAASAPPQALAPAAPPAAAPDAVGHALPAPDARLAASDAPATDAFAGWRAVTGAAAGLALGTGVPLAVGGAGVGALVYTYNAAFAGAWLGIGPALFAIGTVATVIGAAAVLPPLGAILATAGAIWGAQKEGRNPAAAFVGALPGLLLAGLSFALASTACGLGIAATGGGFVFYVPWAIVVAAAVLTGLPAPAVAFVGATLGDAIWPGVRLTLEQARARLGIAREPGDMAY